MHRDWPAITERILTENPIPVTQAAKLVPSPVASRHKHVSANALVGWILRGKRGVLLDGYRGPGKTWWTSAAAIRRFLAELSKVESDRSARARKDGGAMAGGCVGAIDNPAARHRQAEAAKVRLRAMGVKC